MYTRLTSKLPKVILRLGAPDPPASTSLVLNHRPVPSYIVLDEWLSTCDLSQGSPKKTQIFILQSLMVVKLQL